VIEGADRLLAMEEPESSELAAQVLAAEGIRVAAAQQVSKVDYAQGRFAVTTGASRFAGENLLVATGRRAELAKLGLETIGLDPQARAIAVDDRMRAAEGAWAVGDVTGRGAFTHIAMYQAGVAINDILGKDGPPADYRALPRVTFMDPEIGAVGLTESQAREQGLTVQTGVSQVSASARGWIHKAGNEGFLKLVADADRGVLVGATSAGPVGGEVLSALAVAIHGEVPVERLRHMIFAYPTFHRGIADALKALA
jgi:pyruvate/2-oxoglutarate dehydrogenase complex dihydrolipoamide dehydrogenase (E3) component